MKTITGTTECSGKPLQEGAGLEAEGRPHTASPPWAFFCTLASLWGLCQSWSQPPFWLQTSELHPRDSLTLPPSRTSPCALTPSLSASLNTHISFHSLFLQPLQAQASPPDLEHLSSLELFSHLGLTLPLPAQHCPQPQGKDNCILQRPSPLCSPAASGPQSWATALTTLCAC